MSIFYRNGTLEEKIYYRTKDGIQKDKRQSLYKRRYSIINAHLIAKMMFPFYLTLSSTLTPFHHSFLTVSM